MSDETPSTPEPAFTDSASGTDYYGHYLARVGTNSVGHVTLELIEDDETVLVREGDVFVTLFAGAPLDRASNPHLPPPAPDGDDAA